MALDYETITDFGTVWSDELTSLCELMIDCAPIVLYPHTISIVVNSKIVVFGEDCTGGLLDIEILDGAEMIEGAFTNSVFFVTSSLFDFMMTKIPFHSRSDFEE